MEEYTLDMHLKQCCEQYKNYENLNSTWSLNRNSCADALETVIITYPHFSMHDVSHAETIINKIEKLLGERIKLLSPTDTWLLLHAAYTHDLGMIVRWKEIEQVWESDEFQSFLRDNKNNSETELQEACQYICRQKEFDVSNFLWPLKMYKYVRLVNAAYFRNTHGELSGKYIKDLHDSLGLDLGHNGMIPNRLIKLLGKICETHTLNPDKILSLDYKTDGFGMDYAHPRLIAMLLRLGDLLDIDNNRFNETAMQVIGGLPESSTPHIEKHKATSHLLVTPEEIQFSSDCVSSDAYMEIRKFITWLEQEVAFFSINWSKIVPQNFTGHAPAFDKKELFINGKPDVDGVEGLKFYISQEKAFNIIEGSNIYEDKFVFIREVIQNAIDASKMQMWNDLQSGFYNAWIDEEIDLFKIQPYEIDEKIYNNYPITIKIQVLANEEIEVTVSDRGTGISIDDFKRMCNVGTSNAGSKQISDTIKIMPKWLCPTAGFGIGLQAIFLVSKEFEIYTSNGIDSYCASVQSANRGGNVRIQRASEKLKRGTTIKITFKIPEEYRYSVAGITYNYLTEQYDPIKDNHIGEVRLLESIMANCGDVMFPITVDVSEKNIETMSIARKFPVLRGNVEDWNDDDKYKWKFKDGYSSICLWDKENAAYGEFNLDFVDIARISLFFKGVTIKNNPMHVSYLFGGIDLYGLETKSSLALNRENLTRRGRIAAQNIFNSMVNFYKKVVIEKLNKDENIPDGFNLYAFWLLCNAEEQGELQKHIVQKITVKVPVIIYEQNGYVTKEVPVKEIIANLNEYYCANLSHFKDRQVYEITRKSFKEIERILKKSDGKYNVIVDEYLTNNLIKNKRCSELILPVENEKLILYRFAVNEKTLIHIDMQTKYHLLCGLNFNIVGFDYPRSSSEPSMRYAIPAMEEYAAIAVSQLLPGISYPYYTASFYIIAPFNREELLQLPKDSQDGFVTAVLSLKTFEKLIDIVLEKAVFFGKYNREDVIAGYKKLLIDYYDLVISKVK